MYDKNMKNVSTEARTPSLLYRIQRAIFRFIGDIKWAGITHPFWFTINAKGYRLKGLHTRRVERIIRPGDIVIRRFEGYVSSFLIPGFWNHAGIYVGSINGFEGEKTQVVHAISDGVIVEDILDFMRTDEMMILRPDPELIDIGIKKAIDVIGSPYDFGFDFKDCNRFSCTELIAYCYPSLITHKSRWSSLGKKVIVADDIRDTEAFTKVWNSLNEK